MDYLNFIILFFSFFLILLYTIESDEFQVPLFTLWSILFVCHTFFFIANRDIESKWFYELEKTKRNVELLEPREVDSINELTHKKRHFNKHWFRGQYIKDEVDTIQFINILNHKDEGDSLVKFPVDVDELLQKYKNK